jgi:hypothetical protein
MKVYCPAAWGTERARPLAARERYKSTGPGHLLSPTFPRLKGQCELPVAIKYTSLNRRRLFVLAITMSEASTGSGLLENWKCLLACTLVSMSPFQYGIDFGAIGGLQAMPGFLAVHPTHNLHRPSSPTNNKPRSSATRTPAHPSATTSPQAVSSSSPPS